MRWTVNGSLLAVIPVFLAYVLVKMAFVPADVSCPLEHFAVRGQVEDTNAHPVNGIWIEVRNQSGDTLAQAITDEHGGFSTGRFSTETCEKVSIRVWGHGYAAQHLSYYPPHDGKSGELPHHLTVRLRPSPD